MSEAGARAVMLFLVQRGDCSRMEIAGDIDPGYQEALRSALGRGVEALCYTCNVAPEAIELDRGLALAL